MDRRLTISSILQTLSITAAAASSSTLFPSPTNAATDEGIAAITDSTLGKSVRKSAIQGARVIDRIDESWERFSDSLRDENKCDANTGRRLYDNGFRKDGTRVGNPVLGAMCEPQPLEPLDGVLGENVLDWACQSALQTLGNGNMEESTVRLQKMVQETQALVQPSFERTIKLEPDPESRKRMEFNFKMYATMRAISTFLNNPKLIRTFQLTWGQYLASTLAPNASRNDYISPFPEIKDEFEDYDYDKDKLLDALGVLTKSLSQLQKGGVIGHFEISIPYDDYGSVVTVALDDYTPIGAELLLSEQGYGIAGPAQALVRHVLDKAKIEFGLDTFYIDPTTTKQSEYNPHQLLLSLSNVRKR